jgi:tetratricopeptide (TPR) repeat protein
MNRFPTGSRSFVIRFSWGGFVVIALAMFVLTAGTTSLPAKEQEEERLGDLQTEETASMRESTYKELAKAQEASEAENYSEAIRILDKLSEDELNSYESSQALNLYAYIYYSQDNYPKAIQTYERLLDQPDLPEALQTATVYTLSQLYFTTENWAKAIDMLKRWIALGGEAKAQTYELIAQAHYQLGDYRNALQPARQVIEMTAQSGKPVKENSYLLLRVLHYELEDNNQVAAVLQELIKRFPKKQYWMQLVGIYGELGNEKKQIATLELAYLQGYLDTETEVLTLAGLLLQNDVPYKAGKILKKGIDDGVISSTYDHWRLLSQAWTLAQEDALAIPALQRAAQLTEDGELDIILGQTYMNLDRWSDAAQAVRTAIRKGGIDRVDQAQVMLGQALFNMNAFDEARTAFQAAQTDARSRKLAGRWLAYVDNEQQRLAQLAAALE